jgi:hypothetical protein
MGHKAKLIGIRYTSDILLLPIDTIWGCANYINILLHKKPLSDDECLVIAPKNSKQKCPCEICTGVKYKKNYNDD